MSVQILYDPRDEWSKSLPSLGTSTLMGQGQEKQEYI